MAAPQLDGLKLGEATTANVKQYYGETLQSSLDLKTTACCAGAPPPHVKAALQGVPEEVVARFYGCGSPLPLGLAGCRVVDLGCGSGRDCYAASALVGPSGTVTGVDMTAAQLEVARRHTGAWAARLGYANLSFVEAQIEALPLPDASADLVISNCVVNLSPDKAAVLREVWRVLRDGGEFHFSDVFADRRLPTSARSDPVLVGECLGGALYVQDFVRLCQAVGFADPRVLSQAPVEVTDPALAAALGGAKFASITYRLFKLPGRLESLCEDYGQYAVYKGTLPGAPFEYALDDHHTLQARKPFLVCDNTAAMLGETWLGPHFEVHGDRSTHYGLFDCAPAPAAGAGAGAACCA